MFLSVYFKGQPIYQIITVLPFNPGIAFITTFETLGFVYNLICALLLKKQTKNDGKNKNLSNLHV